MSSAVNKMLFNKKTNKIKTEIRKKSTNKAEFYRKFKDLASSSTIHGIPNILRSSNAFIKILWSFFFLLSSGLCSYMVFLSVSNYFEYDVVTKVRIVDQAPILFPTVLICNANPFLTKESSAYIKQVLLSEMSLNITNLTKTEEYLYIANRLMPSFAASPFLNDSIKKSFGFPLEKILYYCSYNNKVCNASDFTWHFDFSFGNCFKYNDGISAEIKSASTPGNANGFTFIFLLPKLNNDIEFQAGAGLRIILYNNSHEPKINEGVFVQPGKSTFMQIKKTLINKQPYPYSECSSLNKIDPELSEYIKGSYRQHDCFELCLQRMIIDKCGCYFLQYPKLFNSKPCLNFTLISCARQEYKLQSEIGLKKKCSLSCPLECGSVLYDYSASVLDFPSVAYYKALKGEFEQRNGYAPSFEEMKQGSYALSIYYTQLEYTEISELVKTNVFDLFSNVGGTLGLFLGLSILSFIEVVEILFEMAFLWISF